MLARSLLQISSITSPLDISGCVLWLDAADSSTITESGGAISQWNDKSASAAHVAQSNASFKPSYVSAVQNGKNVVRGDGNDTLNTAGSTLLRSVSGWTIFTVQKTAQNTALAVPCAVMTGDVALVRAVGVGVNVTTGYSTLRSRRLTADSIITMDDTTQVSTAGFYQATGRVDFSATTGTIWLNGTQAATSASYGTNGSTPNDGGTLNVLSATTGAQFWTGDVGEIIYYNTALGTAQRQLVESYLKIKWGL